VHAARADHPVPVGRLADRVLEARMSQPSPLPDDEISDLMDDPQARAWFEEHLAVMREDAYGQRILYFVLAATFLVGLVAYVVGYVLRSASPAEPFGLLADMIYTLGFALWTAAVVVVLVEIIPEAKRRQIRRYVEAYEAVRREKARTTDKDSLQQS
jgi:hypothetical protein